MPREIITLQLGHYANFVGAHFWNLQEANFRYCCSSDNIPEINHDIIFREGKTPFTEVVTYTPRLIAFDLHGSLGGSILANDMYEEEKANPLKNYGCMTAWQGIVDVNADPDVWRKNKERFDGEVFEENISIINDATHLNSNLPETDEISDEQKEIDKVSAFSDRCRNPILKNKSVTKVWNDVLATRWHPKSLHILEEYHHDATFDSGKAFNCFDFGSDLLRLSAARDLWEDQIHFFTEECDYLQGFQVLTEGHNGFGGLSQSLLEYMEEDFTKKNILTIPVFPTSVFSKDSSQSERTLNLLNTITTTALLGHEWNTLMVPHSLSVTPWLDPSSTRQLPYVASDWSGVSESSALLAFAIDAMTLPLRRSTDSAMTMSEINVLLVQQGKKCATNSLAFPFPRNQSLASILDGDIPLHVPLSPFISSLGTISPPVTQLFSLRGFPQNQLVHPSDKEKVFLLRNRTTVCALLDLYLCDLYPTTTSRSHVCDSPLVLQRPCPLQLETMLSPISTVPVVANQVAVSSLTCATNDIANGLMTLLTEMEKLNLRRNLGSLLDRVELDTLKSYINIYKDMVDSYKEEYCD